jgi:hypothetical protein
MVGWEKLAFGVAVWKPGKLVSCTDKAERPEDVRYSVQTTNFGQATTVPALEIRACRCLFCCAYAMHSNVLYYIVLARHDMIIIIITIIITIIIIIQEERPNAGSDGRCSSVHAVATAEEDHSRPT